MAAYVYSRINASKTTAVYKQPVEVADAYLNALKKADYESAFALCDTSLQKKLGSTLNLQVETEGYHVQPFSWQYDTPDASGTQVDLHGQMTFRDAGEGTFDLMLTEYKEGWKISKYTLTRDS